MAPRQALNERLEELRAELESSEKLTEPDRRRLEALLRSIRAHAAGEASEDDDEPESIADQLRDATEQLEEEHPRLTFAIGAVADALSRIGI